MRKILKGSEKTWNSFLKPDLNIASPYNVMAVSARTNNHEIGNAMSDIFRNKSRGKALRLNDMYGNGLRLR